jgi:hypothetical protein
VHPASKNSTSRRCIAFNFFALYETTVEERKVTVYLVCGLTFPCPAVWAFYRHSLDLSYRVAKAHASFLSGAKPQGLSVGDRKALDAVAGKLRAVAWAEKLVNWMPRMGDAVQSTDS